MDIYRFFDQHKRSKGIRSESRYFFVPDQDFTLPCCHACGSPMSVITGDGQEIRYDNRDPWTIACLKGSNINGGPWICCDCCDDCQEGACYACGEHTKGRHHDCGVVFAEPEVFSDPPDPPLWRGATKKQEKEFWEDWRDYEMRQKIKKLPKEHQKEHVKRYDEISKRRRINIK